jgi:hypoxanthine phosphoribosyltransferase
MTDRSETQPHINFGWDTIHTAIDTLALMVEPIRPKLIVGVSRGGLIPATMLSHRLNNLPVEVVSAKAYEGTRRTIQKPIVIEGWQDRYNQDDVVVVDDIMDSGDTLDKIINSGGYFRAHFACLVKKKSDRYPNITNYFAQVPLGTWVKFPWE